MHSVSEFYPGVCNWRGERRKIVVVVGDADSSCLALLDLLEPSPSPTLPGPSRAMMPPNFSRPRASGSGNSPWSHRRTQSTDTIVHNPDKGKGKGKSLDHERHSTGYPTPRKSQEPGHHQQYHHQPEEVKRVEEKEKATFAAERRPAGSEFAASGVLVLGRRPCADLYPVSGQGICVIASIS